MPNTTAAVQQQQPLPIPLASPLTCTKADGGKNEWQEIRVGWFFLL